MFLLENLPLALGATCFPLLTCHTSYKPCIFLNLQSLLGLAALLYKDLLLPRRL